MKGVIVFKKEGMDYANMHDIFGPDSMANSIHICDCTVPDKNDGDEVEVTVKGKLIEADGKRFIAVHTVDGKDVVETPSMEDEYDHPPEPNMMDMNAEDALRIFFNKTKKG